MKPSGDPWTASAMKENNKRHETPVRDFFQNPGGLLWCQVELHTTS